VTSDLRKTCACGVGDEINYRLNICKANAIIFLCSGRKKYGFSQKETGQTKEDFDLPCSHLAGLFSNQFKTVISF
jgi:hypothetical protein